MKKLCVGCSGCFWLRGFRVSGSGFMDLRSLQGSCSRLRAHRAYGIQVQGLGLRLFGVYRVQG